MKKFNKNTLLSTLLCLVPALIGLIAYSGLSEKLIRLAKIEGSPVGRSGKILVVIAVSACAAVVNLVFSMIVNSVMQNKTIDIKVKLVLQWIIPVACVLGTATTLATGFVVRTTAEVVTPLLLGLGFVIVGSYLPEMKQNDTVGIKIPWTINSEKNWNRTHHFAGPLWVVCGLLIMIATYMPYGIYILWTLAVLTVAGPVAFSYLIYKYR